MTNSRAKGKRGELDAAKALNAALGTNARRSQQYNGIGKGDIVDAIPGVHIEVKRYKTFGWWKHVRQAREDAEPGDIPVVMMRPDGDKDWHIAVPVKRLVEFVEAIGRGNDDQ